MAFLPTMSLFLLAAVNNAADEVTEAPVGADVEEEEEEIMDDEPAKGGTKRRSYYPSSFSRDRNGFRVVSGDTTQYPNKNPQCVPQNERAHAVQCCKDDQGDRPTEDECDDNVAVSYSEASTFCTKKKGWHLCTEAQVTKGQGKGEGCGYDSKMVWTSTPCDSAVCVPYSQAACRAAAKFLRLELGGEKHKLDFMPPRLVQKGCFTQIVVNTRHALYGREEAIDGKLVDVKEKKGLISTSYFYVPGYDCQDPKCAELKGYDWVDLDIECKDSTNATCTKGEFIARGDYCDPKCADVTGNESVGGAIKCKDSTNATCTMDEFIARGDSCDFSKCADVTGNESVGGAIKCKDSTNATCTKDEFIARGDSCEIKLLGHNEADSAIVKACVTWNRKITAICKATYICNKKGTHNLHNNNEWSTCVRPHRVLANNDIAGYYGGICFTSYRARMCGAGQTCLDEFCWDPKCADVKGNESVGGTITCMDNTNATCTKDEFIARGDSCDCNDNQHTCTDGQCVTPFFDYMSPDDLRCDGWNDCEDGSDELNCA